jgi:hypothetical protein
MVSAKKQGKAAGQKHEISRFKAYRILKKSQLHELAPEAEPK